MEELALAKAQADHQDQQLQEMERKDAAGFRGTMMNFIGREFGKAEDWQLQMDNRHASKHSPQKVTSNTIC